MPKSTKKRTSKSKEKSIKNQKRKEYSEKEIKQLLNTPLFDDNVKTREPKKYDYQGKKYTYDELDILRSRILNDELNKMDNEKVNPKQMMNTVGPPSVHDRYYETLHRARQHLSNKEPKKKFSFSKITGLVKPHVTFSDDTKKKGGKRKRRKKTRKKRGSGPAGQPTYRTRQITREAEIERKKQSLKRELANTLNISINIVNYYSNIYTGNYTDNDASGLILSNQFVDFVKEKEEIRKKIEEDRRIAAIEEEKRQEEADKKRRTVNMHDIFVDKKNNPLYISSNKVTATKETMKLAKEIDKFYKKNKDNVDSFSFADATKIVKNLRKKGMTYPEIENYQIPRSYKYKKKIGTKLSKMKEKCKNFVRNVTGTRRARVTPIGGRKKTKHRRKKTNRKRNRRTHKRKNKK